MQPIASSATGSSCGKGGAWPWRPPQFASAPAVCAPERPPNRPAGRPGPGRPFLRHSGVGDVAVPPAAAPRLRGRLWRPARSASGGPRGFPGGAHTAPGVRPAPATAPATVSTPDQALLPPAPALDSLVPPEELAAELRLAADSAADEAVLEALDDARPADDDTDEALPADAGQLGHRRRYLQRATTASSTTSTSSRARAASAWASGSRACRATRG